MEVFFVDSLRLKDWTVMFTSSMQGFIWTQDEFRQVQQPQMIFPFNEGDQNLLQLWLCISTAVTRVCKCEA